MEHRCTAGQGQAVPISNLQDSIHYYFAVYAIAKNGKYKEPAVKDYIPEIYPKYSYTGNHTIVKDENNHWRIKFLSSGVLEWMSEDAQIDVFLVGGGGAGGTGAENMCGGGGYTKTVKGTVISKGQRSQVSIGAGGSQGDGGTTYFNDNVSAAGGKAGSKGRGGDGGYGGGGGGTATKESSIATGAQGIVIIRDAR